VIQPSNRPEYLLRRSVVLGANEQFESTAGLRHVRPHAARRVCLDHGVDFGGLKRALSHFRFRQGTKRLDYNKVIHGFILGPRRNFVKSNHRSLDFVSER
jgi:hypothetical protein